MMRRRFAAGDKFDYRNYMTIEPLRESIRFTSYISPYIEYTTDGREWKRVYPNDVVALKKDYLYSFKKITEKGNSVGTFYIDGAFNLKGNCMSLVYGDNAVGKTSLAEYDSIFNELFLESRGLQNVDEGFLPATTLAPYCYCSMFAGTGIQNSPILPAENLESSCYDRMFRNCVELTQITALFTTTPSGNYTFGWVEGISPTGTFVKNPNATWEVYGDNGIPNGWKVVMDGEESGGEFNFQTTIVDGFGEYTQEQYDELGSYLAETYGNKFSGSGEGFKYTFNGYRVASIVYSLIGAYYAFGAILEDDAGEVEFGSDYSHIILY